MKKNICLTLILISLVACASPVQPNEPEITATPQAIQTTPEGNRSAWSVYHPDPDHPWNRVFRQLYRRTTIDGEEYGAEELDPLLWFDTTHLLDGDSHDRAIRVLDEFLASHAETLIQHPLHRAMFQRDLWAVFDWLASQEEPYPAEREALQSRIAEMMKRVALPKNEILSLPDNYVQAIESRLYPTNIKADAPDTVFLPGDIFQPESAWVSMGREGGPIAMTHTEAFPFFGRSVFLVFVRSSDGREATLDFIQSLNTEPHPVTAIGSEVALVRRMLLIDDQGEIVVSPLVETIQLRHFSPAQSFHEFELDRIHLFEGIQGGLVLNRKLFTLFMGHGDVFENPDIPDLQATIPDICKACHFGELSDPDAANTQTIVSYSRRPFPLPDQARPVLFATTVEEESQTVIAWKRNHTTWKSLEMLWDQTSP